MVELLQAMAGTERGGAATAFVRLAGALHRAGIEQTVVIAEDPARAAALRAEGVEPVQLPFGGRLDMATGRGLKKLIRETAPRVVVTWDQRATGVMPGGDFVHVARPDGKADGRAYRGVDHLVVDADAARDVLIRSGWAETRVHVLPTLITDERMEPADRKALFTPGTAPVVLALSRMDAIKGIDTLLKAVRRVPDVYLWLAGDGPIRGKLETLAHESGAKPRTRFLGWRDDVPALLAASDMLCCPDPRALTGSGVLEGWARGLPVVAADSLGAGSLIEHGATGLLAPVDDVEALARSIKWMARNPDAAQDMAAKAQTLFGARFSERVVLDAVLGFLDGLASGASDGRND